ncbi:MAG: response regulator [Gemmatimonadaceae bacterium]|nr:response regulator [Gemmatimonadaceae bacterium]
MTEDGLTPRPPLILLANEHEWAARSLETILGPHGFAVLRAYTGRQLLGLVRSAQPDLIMVDVRLPDMRGVDVCRALRDDPHFPEETPIIFTSSGTPERHERLEAFKAGAWEIVSQPLDAEVLLLKLDAYMRGKRAVDRLRDESLLDQATGLYNMQGMVRRAREMSADAQRLHAPISCVAFTPVATTDSEMTSPAITEIMVERLGAIVRRTGRASDAIGRLGPTEFAIIAPATEEPGAIRMMERLESQLSDMLTQPDGIAQRVELRAGYCSVADGAKSAVDAVEMLLRANSALRDARSAQRSDELRSYDSSPLRFAL